MKHKRRTEDGFNLSFLDVMACGLGAVVLIFILVDFNAFSDTAAPEQKKLESELAAAEREQQQLQKSIDEINENIAMEAGKQDESQQNQNETTRQQDKLLQDISSQLAVVADLENQLAAVASIPTPDANIAMSGTGEQSYITGMRVEGKHIGILIDKSASMMGDNLIEVLSKLALPDNKKIASAKWRRTRRVANWLLARLPQTSKVSVVAFSDTASVLGMRPVNTAGASGSLKAIAKQIGEIVPDGGTNLQDGLATMMKANPDLTDLYLITDGLPTLGEGLPLKCRNFISSKKSISSDCRQLLFLETVKRGPRGVTVNVILLPIEGDPFAPSLYWSWTNSNGGTFLSPAPEWP